MVSNRSRFFVVCISLAIIQPLSDRALAAEPWEMTLTTAKDEVLPGEPVVIRWTVTNLSDVREFTGEMGPGIYVSSDGERFVEVDTRFRFFGREEGGWSRVEPGETVELERTLLLATNRPMGARGDSQWLIFPRPGEYVIRLHNEKFNQLYTAETTLTVREPEGREREAWQLYRNKGVLVTVEFHRHRTLMAGGRRYRGIEGILDRIQHRLDLLQPGGLDHQPPANRAHVRRGLLELERQARDLNPEVTEQRIERILDQFPGTVYADILRPIHEDMQPDPESGPFDQRAMWAELRQRLEAEGYDVDAFIADYPEEYRRKSSQLFAERREGKISRQEMYEQSAAAFEEILKKHQDPRR